MRLKDYHVVQESIKQLDERLRQLQNDATDDTLPLRISLLSQRAKHHASLFNHECVIQDYSDILDMHSRMKGAVDAESDVGDGEVASLGSTLGPIYLERARAFVAMENFGDATKDLQTASSLISADDPSSAKLQTLQGIIQSSQGNFNQALAFFTSALAVDPKCSEAHENMGVVLESREQYAAALESFSAAIDCDETNWSAFNNRAYVLAELGRFEEARRDVEACLRLWPGCSSAFETLRFVQERARSDIVGAEILKRVIDQARESVDEILGAFMDGLPLDEEDEEEDEEEEEESGVDRSTETSQDQPPPVVDAVPGSLTGSKRARDQIPGLSIVIGTTSSASTANKLHEPPEAKRRKKNEIAQEKS